MRLILLPSTLPPITDPPAPMLLPATRLPPTLPSGDVASKPCPHVPSAPADPLQLPTARPPPTLRRPALASAWWALTSTSSAVPPTMAG